MKQGHFILSSLLCLCAVRASPLDILWVEERHVSTAIERRQLLDGLASIAEGVSSLFSPEETTTATRSASAATRTTDSDDDDETTSVSVRTTATRTSSSERETITSTRRSSSSSEIPTLTITSSKTSSEPTTSETTSSTTSVPAETARAAETPAPSKDGGEGPNIAAIAGGIAGGVAGLIILVVILFWGCGPLKKWRENRAYQKMMDRSYRPALDDPKPFFGGETRETGLSFQPAAVTTVSGGADGYRGVIPTSPHPAAIPQQQRYSFEEELRPEERIRRKPLPTIGTGPAGDSLSPSMGPYATTGYDRAEPWLPRQQNR